MAKRQKGKNTAWKKETHQPKHLKNELNRQRNQNPMAQIKHLHRKINP